MHLTSPIQTVKAENDATTIFALESIASELVDARGKLGELLRDLCDLFASPDAELIQHAIGLVRVLEVGLESAAIELAKVPREPTVAP